jgi:large subunit ribosomal protein L21
MTPSYAIVESGGKQYRAEKGTSLLVDRLPDDEGAKVSLRPVMYRAEASVLLKPDELDKVKVEAVVAEHLRGPKVRVVKYRPKKGYRRYAGHRSELTKLEVTDVRMLQRKPAATRAEAGGEAEAKPKPAPRKPGAKAKPAAARKPATKKPPGGARKPAARKTTSTAKKASDGA